MAKTINRLRRAGRDHRYKIYRRVDALINFAEDLQQAMPLSQEEIMENNVHQHFKRVYATMLSKYKFIIIKR